MSGPQASVGICPLCEQPTPSVGEPCANAACRRRGVHGLAPDEFERARAEAVRRKGALDPMLGRRIAKYVLVGKLGEGGMGAVYLALQMPLRREVALKVISAPDADDVALARFAREAAATALLEHPNIVKLYDFGPESRDQGPPYMVLEVVRGRSLRKELEARAAAGSGWSTRDLRRLFHQVLTALAAAHDKGVIHRDIKPENIMLAAAIGAPDHVKILDFGLARAVEQLQGAEEVSRTGTLVGTPAYMAPEQFLQADGQEIDQRVDLYAVGVLAFEVLTGRRPFAGRSWKEIAFAKISDKVDPVGALGEAELPPAQVAFLRRALAKDRDRRFGSALEMSQAFQEALGPDVPETYRVVAPVRPAAVVSSAPVGLVREAGEGTHELKRDTLALAPVADDDELEATVALVTPPRPRPASSGTCVLEPERGRGAPRALAPVSSPVEAPAERAAQPAPVAAARDAGLVTIEEQALWRRRARARRVGLGLLALVLLAAAAALGLWIKDGLDHKRARLLDEARKPVLFLTAPGEAPAPAPPP